MNELLLAHGQQQRENNAPPGQVEWTTPGTHQWIVPEGVYSISAVVVGAGDASYLRMTPSGQSNRVTMGHGGALAYINNLKCTPGQVVEVMVGSGEGLTNNKESSILGLRAGVYNDKSGPNGYVGYNGGSSTSTATSTGRPTPTDRTTTGGSAAYFDKNGDRAGTGCNTQGQSFPRIQASPGELYANPGAGGSYVFQRTGDRYRYSRGGDGAVRVIWGENRAFPDLNTADILPDE